MSDQKEKTHEKDEDDRLVDGKPGTGIVPLGELTKVDRVTEHTKKVEESAKQGYRW